MCPLLLELRFDDLLKLLGVHGEPANGFRHLFRRHGILVHLETEGLLVDAHALDAGVPQDDVKLGRNGVFTL